MTEDKYNNKDLNRVDIVNKMLMSWSDECHAY